MESLLQKQASLPLSASPFPNDISINRKRQRLTAAWRLQQKAGLPHHKEVWLGLGDRLTGGVGSRRVWGDWDRRDRKSLGVLSGHWCSGDLGR